MLKTIFGTFNGDTWENLCQQIFKKKYASEGYQEMVSSPGDFGIEGFTKNTGLAFQCYCPDKHYTQAELYNNQRDKITKQENGKVARYQRTPFLLYVKLIHYSAKSRLFVKTKISLEV